MFKAVACFMEISVVQEGGRFGVDLSHNNRFLESSG